jgi:hypothetical protein
MLGRKGPPAPRQFKQGVGIEPAAAAAAWLAAQGRRIVRVPARLPLDEYGQLAALRATIGASLEFTVDDARLGIGLADRVREQGPATGPSVLLWLEGNWSPRGDDGMPSLRLTAVGARTDETYLFVEV